MFGHELPEKGLQRLFLGVQSFYLETKGLQKVSGSNARRLQLVNHLL
jgi:hypothetical protein